MIANTRELAAQSDKKNPQDFALWKKAEPQHIMRWPSPWSDGFPGWHLECTVMSTKYLGEQFDIHGGGMDLKFPHHECEIAQGKAASGKDPVNYWMHNNMITVDGKKMGKSLGNFINLEEFFTGNHAKLDRAYTPMTIRFFILQAHYRSTVDFSNEALQAAEKGFNKLMTAMETLQKLSASKSSTYNVNGLEEKCYAAMDDDFNTPKAFAVLFDMVKEINRQKSADMESASQLGALLVKLGGHLGLLQSQPQDFLRGEVNPQQVEQLIAAREQARADKDWARADQIRDQLSAMQVVVEDGADGSSWRLDR